MDTTPHRIPSSFHECTRDWFSATFPEPTRVQTLAWPAIAAGRSTLLLAPTGSGKTLAAFLAALDRLMLGPEPGEPGIRVLYVSPLKALGVDVDRNLRVPIRGLSEQAHRAGVVHRIPQVGIRTGDTSAAERRTMARTPPDILITTPESLYLLMTSRARETLSRVETVIVDEIHAIAGTKRGAHLFVTLERLERLRSRAAGSGSPLQRVGLSATQRPLEEIAGLLGGAQAEVDPGIKPVPRPVDIIDGSAQRQFRLTVETPADETLPDSAVDEIEADDGENSGEQGIPSVWPSIHPRLVELIRAHRCTMIFVNSRRLSERLAAALNELAGEELALAHHGSIAHDARSIIEDRLKNGELPAIIATSSMELGIDMGAVDLVIQVEAPPSIASGTQRIGRSGHQVGAASTGVIFPKFRGDLLACSAATGAMHEGWVEETHYPRNPLDVLAQQIVAMTAREPMLADDVFAIARSAAPFFELPRASFDGVLDLLSGRYPSDEFAELRPRINYDRIEGTISPRRGAQRLAILNGGTIPDRGLFGVYLVGDGPNGTGGSRVGELDEEMVFETLPGDVFLLGASSWRALEITRDRVLVAPAPGEPGRMPFWRGDGPGRPYEFGRAIGRLTRELIDAPRDDAHTRLVDRHGLAPAAAESLLQYLTEQAEATGAVPGDRTIVVETVQDEVGDWRVIVLTPFGRRVHAPWATVVAARLRQENSGQIDVMWTDDGMAFRVPETDQVPPVDWFLPRAEDVEHEIVRHVGATPVFAGRFRENAARALLLPRRFPGRRTPLWLQRRRATDLLNVAVKYPEFPILLETYRECLSDVFDVQSLVDVLSQVQQRSIDVRAVRNEHPSPFAAAVLFSYAGNFLYDGDAPLAERRAQTLSLDHAQLRELLGSVDFRQLFDGEVVKALAGDLQRISDPYVRCADHVHDLLLRLGGLSLDEIAERCAVEHRESGRHVEWVSELLGAGRIISVVIAGDDRLVAAEDAARLRDALGVNIPDALPDAFLEPVADPLGDLVSRYARTHIPFAAAALAARFGIGVSVATGVLEQLCESGRVLQGEFLPGGTGQEWCDAQVFRQLRARSLTASREQVRPVDPVVFARFLPAWHAIDRPRRGLDGLLDAIEQLQGAVVPVSSLEEDILPARVQGYRTRDLDELCLAGEVVWRGFDGAGGPDGPVAVYLRDYYDLLAPPVSVEEDPVADELRELFRKRGALLFSEITRAMGGFPNDVLDELWKLVWSGELTNDTLGPVRALKPTTGTRAARMSRRATVGSRRAFRSRRAVQLPGSEGRWSLLPSAEARGATSTERQAAIAAQLLERHGIVTREMLSREQVTGGFSGLYPVLRAMEESGKVRRGYFVEGLGAAQFAACGADDRLRTVRDAGVTDSESALVLAATDPASPWGSVLPWPGAATGRFQRAAGARVVLLAGAVIGYLGRTRQTLVTFPVDDPEEHRLRSDALIKALADLAKPGASVLLETIDGARPGDSPLAPALLDAGFVSTSRGYLHKGLPPIG